MKSMDEFKRWAAVRGWSIRRTKGDHLQLKKPGCQILHVSSTPSDHRAIRNMRSAIKRAEKTEGDFQHVK